MLTQQYRRFADQREFSEVHPAWLQTGLPARAVLQTLARSPDGAFVIRDGPDDE